MVICMKKIVTIAEFIFLNKEKYTEEEIIKKLKITQSDFNLFTQTYSPEFAITLGENKWALTQDGVNVYLNQKNQLQQAELNKLVTVATIMGGILSLIGILKLFKINELTDINQIFIIGVIIIFIIGVIIIFIIVLRYFFRSQRKEIVSRWLSNFGIALVAGGVLEGASTQQLGLGVYVIIIGAGLALLGETINPDLEKKEI